MAKFRLTRGLDLKMKEKKKFCKTEQSDRATVVSGGSEGLTRPKPQLARTPWWRSPRPPGWSEPLLGMTVNHFMLGKTTQNSNLRLHCSLATCTCQQHVEFAHAGVEVDGGAKEVEGGGVLLHGQVHQAQVVEHLPVKGRQVVRPLQAADGLKSYQIIHPV